MASLRLSDPGQRVAAGGELLPATAADCVVKSELAECQEAKLPLLGAGHPKPTHCSLEGCSKREPSCNLSLFVCWVLRQAYWLSPNLPIAHSCQFLKRHLRDPDFRVLSYPRSLISA